MIPVDTNELRTIALRNFDRIPTSRGDALDAFLQVILIWLAEWSGDKQHRTEVKPGYCAFVLAPELVGGDGPEGAERTFYFKDDTTPQLGGNVYLTDYALNNVWRFAGDCKDLTDVVSLLTARDVAHLPFVAFDIDTRAVYVFTEGATELSLRFSLRPEIPRPFTIDVFMEIPADLA